MIRDIRIMIPGRDDTTMATHGPRKKGPTAEKPSRGRPGEQERGSKEGI